ncbi:MAG TPA: desulfoferrodoxin [Thermoplasmatales archaeon]|nr:desulfoferrodoxin [Thermoplasmatales archaeon]
MTEKLEIYKCEACGNIVEVIHEGKGELVCCKQPMKLLVEQTADTSTEKHVPFIERRENKYIVRVGENTKHPMEEKHYIEWIELMVDGVTHRCYLKPGDEPEAVFELPEGNKVSARELCNIHGLWVKK